MKILASILVLFLPMCAGYSIRPSISYTTARGNTLTVSKDGKTIVLDADFQSLAK